jgi:hypothetical protein
VLNAVFKQEVAEAVRLPEDRGSQRIHVQAHLSAF